MSQVSSGSFYNYFGSNDELAHALIDFEWSKLKAAILVPVLDASGDPITRLFWMSDDPNCAGCLLGNLIVELVEHDASFLRTFCSSFYGYRNARSLLYPDVVPAQAEQPLTFVEGVLLMGHLYKQPVRLHKALTAYRSLLKA